MKKIYCLLVLSVLTFCSFSAPDWLLMESKEAGFRISFPKKPEASTDTTHTSPRLVWKALMYNGMPDKDDNSIYGLSYSDQPADRVSSDFKDARIDTFLDNVLANSVTGVNGEVLKKEPVSFKDYPGRHYKISFARGKAIMDLRIYLIGSRCYILQVGYMAGKEGNPSIEKFYNSFELL